MARPTKQGIDYFPLDVDFDDAIEMYLLEKQGLGLAVLVTSWQLIYRNFGYYAINGSDFCLLIKKRISEDISSIKDCINACLIRGIFDETLHEQYGILTSRAIQKRYFDAAKRKQAAHYIPQFILIDVSVCENLVDVSINSTIVNNNAPNINTNINKNKKAKTQVIANPLFEEFIQVYPRKNGKLPYKEVARKRFQLLSPDDQLLCLQAIKNYVKSERVVGGFIKDPHSFICDGRNKYEFWRDWIEPEISAKNGNLSGKTCWKRIPDGEHMRPCKEPVVAVVANNPHCAKHPVPSLNGVST